MRLPAPLLSLIILLASNPPRVSAIPPAIENLLAAIEKRQCQIPCGSESQYCCSAGSVCYTNAETIALCSASVAGGGSGGEVHTTTYVETDLNTITSTFTLFPAVTTSQYIAESTANCFAPQIACGTLCCASNQYCYTSGQCMEYGANSNSYIASYTSYATATSAYSAPLRPTSGATSTTTVAATTTEPFQTPVGTAGGAYGITPVSANHSLSGGAIAGIVIGSIAAAFIVALIMLCCCFRAAFNSLLACLGLRNPNRRKTVRDTTIIEERRYSRYGSGPGPASRRETHGTWFGGGRGGRGGTTVVSEKRKSNAKKETGILAGTTLSLGALWALLGLKRPRDERRRVPPPRSDVSYDTYSESYTSTDISE